MAWWARGGWVSSTTSTWQFHAVANNLLHNQKSPTPAIKHLIKLIKIDGWNASNLFLMAEKERADPLASMFCRVLRFAGNVMNFRFSTNFS